MLWYNFIYTSCNGYPQLYGVMMCVWPFILINVLTKCTSMIYLIQNYIYLIQKSCPWFWNLGVRFRNQVDLIPESSRLGHNFFTSKRWKDRWSHENEQYCRKMDLAQAWLGEWRSHLLIESGCKIACVQCGRFGDNKKNSLGVVRSNWVHQPCLGCKRLPKGLCRLIEAGCFDGALDKMSADKMESVKPYLGDAGLSVGGRGSSFLMSATGRPPG